MAALPTDVASPRAPARLAREVLLAVRADVASRQVGESPAPPGLVHFVSQAVRPIAARRPPRRPHRRVDARRVRAHSEVVLATLDARQRRLPFVVQPADQESLSSWVDRLALELALQRRDVWFRLGLIPTMRLQPIGYGLDLLPEHLRALQVAGAVPVERSRAMLLSSLTTTGFDVAGLDLTSSSSVMTWMRRRPWSYLWTSHACPQCLLERPRVWLLRWKTPWTFLCIRHRGYLVARCATCGTRLQSNISDARQADRCCAASRSPVGSQGARRRADEICGIQVSASPQVPASESSMRLQADLDELLLARPGTSDHAEARARLGEIRRVFSLVLHVGGPLSSDTADPLRDRWERHIAEREADGPLGGAQKPARHRHYGWTPTDPLLIAGALQVAIPLVLSDRLPEAWTAFVSSARDPWGGRRVNWAHLRSFWRPPTRLRPLFHGAVDRQVHPMGPRLDGRVRHGSRLKATSDYACRVPALCWASIFDSGLDDLVRQGCPNVPSWLWRSCANSTRKSRHGPRRHTIWASAHRRAHTRWFAVCNPRGRGTTSLLRSRLSPRRSGNGMRQSTIAADG